MEFKKLKKLFKEESKSGFPSFQDLSYNVLRSELLRVNGVVEITHDINRHYYTKIYLVGSGELYHFPLEEISSYLKALGVTPMDECKELQIGQVNYYYENDYSLVMVKSAENNLTGLYLPPVNSELPIESTGFDWEEEYGKRFGKGKAVIRGLRKFYINYLEFKDAFLLKAFIYTLISCIPTFIYLFILSILNSPYPFKHHSFGLAMVTGLSFTITALVYASLNELEYEEPPDVNTVEGKLSLMIKVTKESISEASRRQEENRDFVKEAQNLIREVEDMGFKEKIPPIKTKLNLLQENYKQLISFKYKLELLKYSLEDSHYEATTNKREQEKRQRDSEKINELNNRISKLLGGSEDYLLKTAEEEQLTLNKLQLGLEEINEQALWLKYYNQSLLELGGTEC